MKLTALLKLSALNALAVFCAGPGLAAQTNLVQNISISITSLSQGPSTTNGSVVTTTILRQRLTTLNVISALGPATGNDFASTSKLLLVSPLPDGDSTIVVKDGTNIVDVTGFFSKQSRSDTVESSVLDTSTGKKTGTQMDIERFQLQDKENNGQLPSLTLHFDVRGLTTAKSKSVVDSQGNVIGEARQITANLSGDGDRNGTNALMQVLLKVTGATLQVQ